jgi:hypothetical protein
LSGGEPFRHTTYNKQKIKIFKYLGCNPWLIAELQPINLLLFSRSITNEMITKYIKAGDLEKLETATLMGKGKQLIGKASWNDSARTYIKNVANVIDELDLLFKSAVSGQTDKVQEILKKNKKYVFARDSQGRTALHLAALHGETSVVKLIISENAEYTQITDGVILTFKL